MEKRQLVLSNGEVISYLEQGQGEKTLVLIHGNTSSSVHYSPLIDRLPKDIKVLAPDLRGFGDSSYYQPIDSLLDLAEDIHLFLKEKKIEKAVIMGWSLGGGVAMEFAAQYPETVEKLILMESTTHRGYPIFQKDEAGKPILGQIYASKEEMAKDKVQVVPLREAQKNKNFGFMSYIYDLTIYTANKPQSEDNIVWVNESLKQRNLVDVDWALANLNMGDKHNLYQEGNKRIQKITCPVMHTWGKKDIIVPEAMVMDNVKALEKQSVLNVYEDCGHSPVVDVPDQLTKDILEFIN